MEYPSSLSASLLRKLQEQIEEEGDREVGILPTEAPTSPGQVDYIQDHIGPWYNIQALVFTRNVLLVLASIAYLVAFFRSRRLPLTYCGGVPGKLRIMLVALIAFPILQIAQDIVYYYLVVPDPIDAYGTFLMLGTLASLSYAATIMLYTFLAMHSHEALRWGLGVLAALLIFLDDLLVLTIPDLLYSPQGFFLGWLPYNLVFVSYSCLMTFRLPSPQTPLWSRQLPTERAELEMAVEEDVRMRTSRVVFLMTGVGWIVTTVGSVFVKDQAVAKTLNCGMTIMYHFLWPVTMYGFLLFMERGWGFEWLGRRRTLDNNLQRGLLFDEVESEKVEEEVAKTINEVLRNSAQEIIIKYSDLKLGNSIARGGSGVIRKARLCGTLEVATKALYSQYMQGDLTEVLAEAKMLAKIKHPNVLVFYGISVSPHNTVYLVTEYCPHGTLETLVLEDKNFSVEHDWYVYSVALCDVLAFLHRMGIAHRDLKPANLLLDSNRVLKLADLGLATTVHQERKEEMMSFTGGIGTPHYLAPEAARACRTKFDPKKVDVYSTALILWFMFHRRHPFHEYVGSPYELVAQVIAGKRPPLGPPVPEWLQDLLTRMWDGRPNYRPTMDEVSSHIRAQAIRHNVLVPEHKKKESNNSPSSLFAPAASSPATSQEGHKEEDMAVANDDDNDIEAACCYRPLLSPRPRIISPS